MRITSAFSINKLVVCTLLSLFSSVAFAQNKASVSGKITDSLSKTPIEFATVAVVNAKDTSLISYTLTQNNGSFKLSGLPAGAETRLIVSTMGYATHRQTFVFKPGENKDLGSIFLNPKSLKEVVIKGERSPVVIRKDTLEFNTEAFKTRPNAVVEDLLKLLPGVQVNMDGSILVNGKSVSKLLIDGKRFFGDDPTVGTKNLDADMVDKVQVYDDRDEDPDHKLTDMEVNKIINLKLKNKIKKSTIGKIYGGEGTRGRYEAGGIISSFRDTLQISVLGLTNNLTHTGFSNADLTGFGGFNRSGGNVQYDGTFGGNGDGGIERMRSTGININNDYGKKLKTNFMYFYYNYVKDYNSKSINEQQLDNTLLTTKDAAVNQLRQRRHIASTLIEWSPDTLQHLRFNAQLAISPTSNDASGTTNNFNTQTPKISDLFSKTSGVSQVNEFNDRLVYHYKINQKNSLTIFQTADIKNSGANNYNFNNLESFTSAVPSSVLDRYTNSNQRNYYGELSSAFNHDFTTVVSYEVFVQSRYYQTANKLATFNKSPDSFYDDFLTDQSNNTVRDHFIENLKNTVTFNFKNKSRLQLAADLEIQSITNNYHANVPTQTRWYAYLFPKVNYYNAKKHYSVSYWEMADPPEVYQIQPITRQVSSLETNTGNPNLIPGIERHLNFYYYNYNNDKQSNIYLNTYAGVTTNNIVQVSTKDDNGFITSTYANKNGGWYAGGSIYEGKQFKKSQIWKFALGNRLSTSFDQRSFYFNGDEGTQYNYSITDAPSANVNYKSVVNLNLTYNLSKNITTYRGVDYPSVSTLRHTVITTAAINWPKHVVFDFQYEYRYNPQIPAGFSRSANILNPAITYMFLKKERAQFKLSAYDLLNQNTMVYRYAANNSITSGENQILRRYFLLTFMYKINSMKTK
ncbi:carboxypeptidase regulatory-like domain-containing protein [Mucilaginibacter panaciglaebae]|uniref:Outer membrane beta-barrel protein n=1 Tax=Mucilaginibacter panaciglaebae TaxID=502331 RepID=A0ABP7W966_9SPHI